ncbi:tripartite tricarboxylate transporter substrate binding protein [Roseococcus sp. SDR]|uniref:Bug family tripartite tricarboxylate transporter substrate binding protein n=1 Tax=Roseococcus sp. SDR TaxID=2835532 RepID=UPI001BCAC714|nr:tripartite tricarboxylate transporter substrate binding protein [Roseococcus sp. SDR]MBS7788947.1 tripartite tricarboxylate transporter substrate binding protein [Roseococcus sp. SDR]MBV1844261.1 tripartite tricarboxylate transporter substrate binding protein [Roseococcus sp. SDR]
MNRRQLLAATPLLATPALVQAQPAWPNRSVRVIIPFTPGGASDLMMRPVAERLERVFGQSFVIDNRPGGGGAVGVGAAANERPDGYTLLMSTAGPLVLLPSMMANLPYNPARSFTYISLMGGAPIVCAVKGDSPIRTLADYAAAAKRAPDAVSFGSSGIGSMGHLTGVLFGMEAGAQLLHAPFRGAPEAQTAVLGGTTTSLWDTAAANVQAIRAGSMRGLCVSSAQRAAILPDVPTAREAGFSNVVSLNWFMLCGPAGLPPAITERLSTAVREILAEPAIRERMDSIAFVPGESVPQAGLAAWVQGEQQRWAPVVRASGASM